MASWFKSVLTASLLFICIAVAVVSVFLLGYWFASSTGAGHWMLVSSGSNGGAQTVGIFQTRRRCLGFLESHKESIKPYLLSKREKLSPEEKASAAALEHQGVMLFQGRQEELSWITISCIRLSNGFAPSLLSDIESAIDDLKRRIGDIERR